MFILRWLREYYELKADVQANKRELQYCESCATLKIQLALANETNKQLIERVLEKPAPIAEVPFTENPKAILPNRLPFHVRRQALESESRNEAKRLQENIKRNSESPAKEPGSKLTVEQIEQEIGVKDATQ